MESIKQPVVFTSRETGGRFKFHVGQNDIRPVSALADFAFFGAMPAPRVAKTEAGNSLKEKIFFKEDSDEKAIDSESDDLPKVSSEHKEPEATLLLTND